MVEWFKYFAVLMCRFYTYCRQNSFIPTEILPIFQQVLQRITPFFYKCNFEQLNTSM